MDTVLLALKFAKDNWKAILGVVVLAAYSFWLWNTSAALKQAEWDREKLKTASAEVIFTRMNQKIIFNLQGIKNENLKTIANLNVDLADARSRVHVPTGCPGTGATPGGQSSATGAGVLQEGAQTGFDRFEQRLEQHADQCDKIVEDCRVVADWAKTQGSEDEKPLTSTITFGGV